MISFIFNGNNRKFKDLIRKKREKNEQQKKNEDIKFFALIGINIHHFISRSVNIGENFYQNLKTKSSVRPILPKFYYCHHFFSSSFLFHELFLLIDPIENDGK